MRNRSSVLVVGVVVLALAMSGCGRSLGPKSWPVVGKITYQGKPVSAGVIRFINSQAAIDATANVGPDGTYEIGTTQDPGLPEGTYQVAIMPRVESVPVGDMKPRSIPNPANIPPRYRLPSTSGLTMTLKPDNNRFDVDMR